MGQRLGRRTSEKPSTFAIVAAAAVCAQLPVAPDGCFLELVRKGCDLLNMCRKGLDKKYARVLQRSAAMV